MYNLFNIKYILGNLNINSFSLNDPILFITFIILIIIIIFILSLITILKLWNKIWNWMISLNHKKIGIMYIILGLIMLIRGFIDALMMRIHQALSFNNSYGFLKPNHYDQIFTVHGVIMIFFVAMPIIIGIMNYIIPLQIGANDMAYPYINNLSFWLNVSGAMLIMISLFIGEFAKTGWLAYPPLSELKYSPSVGVDYYIWALQISGIGTLLSGINFIITIIKLKYKKLKFMKLSIFTWTTLCSNILIVASFPVLFTVLALLSSDRVLHTNFFTNNYGGNPMLYINLIWIWGHPEVYILILPAFGIFSEIVSTFCRKKLFGYNSMIYATIIITILSYIVWLHHFFTMGVSVNVNTFFSITTMIISIPTGIKIFNWLLTIYISDNINFDIPMLWTIAFIITFTIGGSAGVLLSIPAIDYILHNSLFLVAHFHNVIIGGVVFSIFGGINYWFPKFFGFKLNKFWGKLSFVFWIIGYYLAFMPLYILGLMGVTRRLNHFNNNSFKIWFYIAAIGAIFIGIGILLFIIQLIISFIKKENYINKINPWNSVSIEWYTFSPPKNYNFPIKNIKNLNKYYKYKNIFLNKKIYKNIIIPKNNIYGFIISICSTISLFFLIWKMWLLFYINILLLFIIILIFINKKNVNNFYKRNYLFFIEKND